MVVRADDGALRTGPTETPIERNGAARLGAVEYQDVREHIDRIFDILEMIGPNFDKQSDKIRELETRIAVMTGAIDILRGRNLPGTLRVTGTYNACASYLSHDVCIRETVIVGQFDYGRP
jgi:hypothetical protein